jgi:hypothetical protein
MWPTLPLSLFLYSWVFSTGGSVCSHLLTLVHARGFFSTLKMEAIRSSETSVDPRSTQRHIPEDNILHSHRCESLKSYEIWFNWTIRYYVLEYKTLHSHCSENHKCNSECPLDTEKWRILSQIQNMNKIRPPVQTLARRACINMKASRRHSRITSSYSCVLKTCKNVKIKRSIFFMITVLSHNACKRERRRKHFHSITSVEKPMKTKMVPFRPIKFIQR